MFIVLKVRASRMRQDPKYPTEERASSGSFPECAAKTFSDCDHFRDITKMIRDLYADSLSFQLSETAEGSLFFPDLKYALSELMTITRPSAMRRTAIISCKPSTRKVALPAATAFMRAIVR